MDEQRFDNWIRGLGRFPSRRQVVGAIAGALLTAIGIAGHEGAAGTSRNGKGDGRARDRRGRGRDGNRTHVAAQRGGKGKGKKKKKKQGRGGKPAPENCKLDSDRGLCRRCRNRACETNPGEDGLECGECGVCRGGNCVPDPAQSGQQCSAVSCKRCNVRGACAIPDDSLCQNGEICRPADGRCAVPCLENGAVCPPDHVCIDDGVFGDPRRCCNVRSAPGQQPTNFPCGDNGDGTFRQCCSGLTERCCDDLLGKRCIPKDECCVGETKCGNACCPSGQECVDGQCRPECPARLRAADGSCCANGEPPCDGTCCAVDEVCCGGTCTKNMQICPGRTRQPFCAALAQECCGDIACDADQDCCDPQSGLCCEEGRCVGKECCPPNQDICGNACCPLGHVCCGGDCCPSYDCLNDSCCDTGACGEPNSGHRMCPTEEESCCFIEDPDPENGAAGYACPASRPVCAFNGNCCPADTLYREDCGGCCPGLSCNSCVAATPGRT